MSLCLQCVITFRNSNSQSQIQRLSTVSLFSYPWVENMPFTCPCVSFGYQSRSNMCLFFPMSDKCLHSRRPLNKSLTMYITSISYTGPTGIQIYLFLFRISKLKKKTRDIFKICHFVADYFNDYSYMDQEMQKPNLIANVEKRRGYNSAGRWPRLAYLHT